MADTKALFTQRCDAARAAWTKGDEPAAAESFHSAIVAARSDPSLRRELASALFSLGRISRRFGPAGEAEAGRLLTEALAIGEELYGSQNAALAPVLNELSRLYLKQSQHARAADALERLLEISRVKGDEHPDVAAALSDLAFVKRKLGDVVAAEALYRDALRIREKVLEPNHVATVGTLERLAETCAARGNFAEALALLHRALPAREAELGPGHERVRAARSRVAQLELQLAIAADTEAAEAARATRHAKPTPAWLRVADSPVDTPSTQAPSPINSTEPEISGEPEPRVLRPGQAPSEHAKTPTVADVVAVASLIESSIQTPSASRIEISPPESARPSGGDTVPESRAAHREVVLADVTHGAVASGALATDDVASDHGATDDVARDHVTSDDGASDDLALGDWRSPVSLVRAGLPEPARKRPAVYAFAGVAAVTIAIAGLLLVRPRAGNGGDPVSTEMSAAQRTTSAGATGVTTPAMPIGSFGARAAAAAAAAHADSLRAASATLAPTASAVQPEQRASESARPELHLPRVEVHVDSVILPSIPAAPSVDPFVRSAMERQRASDTDRGATWEGASRPASADADNAHSSPRLLERAPGLAFPVALLRAGLREGEVVVRFKVNESGRIDVASMIVERSDHELFTAAVRDVLPGLRFEPARTLGRDSQPVAAWVSVPFRFTTKK